jgi:hypothetical protein
MAAAPDLGSGVERRGGSSPFTRTIKRSIYLDFFYAHVAIPIAIGMVNDRTEIINAHMAIPIAIGMVNDRTEIINAHMAKLVNVAVSEAVGNILESSSLSVGTKSIISIFGVN